MRSPPPRGSFPWLPPTWHGRSASSAFSGAMIRAIIPWWRSAAPGRCTRHGLPPSSTSTGSWCRATPAFFCAMGLLLADLRADFATTRLLALSSAAIGQVETIVAGLCRRCEAWFAEAGIEANARRVALTVDMRYAGQNYELSVPLPAGPVTRATIDGLAAGFAAAHQRLYGFVAEDDPMQLVTFRAEATGIVRKAELRPTAEAGPDPRRAERSRRDVWLPEVGGFVSCPIYDRDGLAPGNRIEGPAIVEQMDATTLIVPGTHATVDRYLNLLLELS